MAGPHIAFRVARTIHAWAGAVLALLLIVIGGTGAMLVWKEDFLRATLPAARAAFDPTPAAVARVALGAESKLGAENVALIYFPTETLGVGVATLQNGDMAYLDGNGAVVARWRVGERFEDWLFDLHHRLLLGQTGLVIAGFAGMAAAALALSGVLAFWPLRRGLRSGIKPADVSRASLLTSHRNIGLFAALPIVVTVLAGVALAFPDEARKIMVHDSEAVQADMVAGLDGRSGAEIAGWGAAMARAQKVFPQGVIRGASWPTAGDSYRVINLQSRSAWSRLGDSQVYIDSTEGYMDIRIDSAKRGWGARLSGALYPMHTARMNNALYKIYATLVGLALTALGMFGFCAFVQRFKPLGSLA